MFGLGPTELIIIAVIVVFIFGAKRLPEIGKGVGGAIREFKKVKKELSSEQAAEKKEDVDSAKDPNNDMPALEAKVVDKVLEQVPGVKKAMDVKKKADQVKDLLK